MKKKIYIYNEKNQTTVTSSASCILLSQVTAIQNCIERKCPG